MVCFEKILPTSVQWRRRRLFFFLFFFHFHVTLFGVRSFFSNTSVNSISFPCLLFSSIFVRYTYKLHKNLSKQDMRAFLNKKLLSKMKSNFVKSLSFFDIVNYILTISRIDIINTGARQFYFINTDGVQWWNL